eukprot:2336859-Amphidinium_carterae.2
MQGILCRQHNKYIGRSGLLNVCSTLCGLPDFYSGVLWHIAHPLMLVDIVPTTLLEAQNCAN